MACLLGQPEVFLLQNRPNSHNFHHPGEANANPLGKPGKPKWRKICNFYRRDDVSATAYFYLDRPSSNLPVLASPELRVKGVELRD